MDFPPGIKIPGYWRKVPDGTRKKLSEPVTCRAIALAAADTYDGMMDMMYFFWEGRIILIILS